MASAQRVYALGRCCQRQVKVLPEADKLTYCKAKDTADNTFLTFRIKLDNRELKSIVRVPVKLDVVFSDSGF